MDAFRTPAQNAAEYAQLEARKSELSNQLQSAVGRRETLVGQLEDATGAARSGLEDRLAVLDARIVQLERDIDVNGQMLAMPPLHSSEGGDLFLGGPGFGKLSSDQITGIAIVFMLFVLAPIAVALARRIWRSATIRQVPVIGADAAQRLERVEQAVESVAIEIERISDGQRFVTRLLGEQRPAPVEAQVRGPDPVLVSRHEG